MDEYAQKFGSTAVVRSEIIIIGAGFSGLGMAIRLKESGIDDFVVLEKGVGVGGVWLHNTYPGCRAHLAAALYSFSFAPKRDWAAMYASQEDLQQYAHELVDRYSLREHLHFDAEVTSMAFDDAANEWQILTRGGIRYKAHLVFAGFGPWHEPSTPKIPGIKEFTGTQIHSSDWSADFDPRGKRIAVVGSGASAVQIVPELAEQADQIHVVQRSAPYILPRFEWRYGRMYKAALRELPGLQRAFRATWAISNEGLYRAQYSRLFRRLYGAFASVYRWQLLKDPYLRRVMTPEYEFGCKSPTVTSTYYPALNRPNVEVIDSGVGRITDNSVVSAKGESREVDAIVWATGFTCHGTILSLPIVGSGGALLSEVWESNPSRGMESYNGTAIAGFPNLFLIIGPNGGMVHTSAFMTIEFQTEYLMEIVKLVRTRCLDRIEVKADAQQEFVSRAHRVTARGVWTMGGCSNDFVDDRGINRAVWPGSALSMWWHTRRVVQSDYLLTPRNS